MAVAKPIDEFDKRHLESMRSLVDENPALTYFERHGEYFTDMPCTAGDAFEDAGYVYGMPDQRKSHQDPEKCVQETYWVDPDWGKSTNQCSNRRGFGKNGLYCKQHAVIHPGAPELAPSTTLDKSCPYCNSRVEGSAHCEHCGAPSGTP